MAWIVDYFQTQECYKNAKETWINDIYENAKQWIVKCLQVFDNDEWAATVLILENK